MMLHNSVTNAMPVILVNSVLEHVSPRYRAAAPEIISINSLVMTACRVLLKVKVSLSIISPANKKLKGFSQMNWHWFCGLLQKKRETTNIYINHSSKATEHKFFVDFVVERIFMWKHTLYSIDKTNVGRPLIKVSWQFN